jgi:serine O-acetyltransferase
MNTHQKEKEGLLLAEPWKLDHIGAELRASRAGSQQSRKEKGVLELPSREALQGILERLFAVLFPAHFGRPDLSDEGIDYFVGHTLDATLRDLHVQVRRELQFEGRDADQNVGRELSK